MLITNLISRYMRLCKAAFSAEDGAKLNKSIQTNVMEMLFLLMVIPRVCQARDKRKLEFAFNSSFTALNVAKIMCKELGTSIGRLKAKMINAYYAQRIIDVFEKSPNTPLNKERINDIFSFATDAA